MSWRYVLGFQLDSAAGAVEFENPAVPGIRGECVFVALRIDDGLVDLAGIAVIDQASGLVVVVSVADVVATAAAGSAFGVQINE